MHIDVASHRFVVRGPGEPFCACISPTNLPLWLYSNMIPKTGNRHVSRDIRLSLFWDSPRIDKNEWLMQINGWNMLLRKFCEESKIRIGGLNIIDGTPALHFERESKTCWIQILLNGSEVIKTLDYSSSRLRLSSLKVALSFTTENGKVQPTTPLACYLGWFGLKNPLLGYVWCRYKIRKILMFVVLML